MNVWFISLFFAHILLPKKNHNYNYGDYIIFEKNK